MSVRPGDSLAAGMVIGLRAVSGVGLQRIGGKAHGLGALFAAGFSVPEGFVVTTEAFEAGRAGDELQMPEHARRAVLEALGGLGSGPFAVRSSAVGEDGADASFAGQFRTVLNVKAEDVPGAVLECWRSAFSECVTEYRARRGGSEVPPVAVVVQRMLTPQAAGVAFTANPVTGDRGEVLVSAVRGLGERLVSGEAAPDEWSVRGEHVEARRVHENALDPSRAAEIARLARTVETRLGGPQDIEWALADDTLWLLQARPLTALPDHVDWAAPLPGGWHRNFRLGEWLPDPVTPLFHSWLLPRLEEGLNGFYERNSGAKAVGPNHVLIHGWYFGSLNFVPSVPSMIWQLLTGFLPRLLTRGLRALAVMPPLHGRCVELFIEDWRGLLGRYRTASARPVASATTAELFEHIEALAALAGEYFGLISLVGGYAWKTELPLARFCREHLDISHQDLLAGLFIPVLAAHDVQSIDWFHPTLGELQQQVADDGAQQRLARLEQARAEAEARARQALAGRPKLAAQFERLLAPAQRHCRVRDEIASCFTLGWPSMRRALARLAGAAVRAGALASADDVHFLSLDQLQAAVSGHGATAPDVAARRAAWERQRRLSPPLTVGTPPPMVRKIFQQTEAAFRGAVPNGALATGLAASPGRAAGTVRIIRDVADFGRLRAGDVLVARATTPVWTVLFPRAGAVVTDLGSVMAHAALVAREYGIPAVVATGNATSTLREGLRVVVDGTQGIVFPAEGGDS